MNLEEENYLALMKTVITKGVDKSDRTGVGTKSIFGSQLRFSLADNSLPLLTTKKMFLKGIIEELLFFIRGETNTKILEEKGVNIWKGNTSREFLDKRGLTYLPEGSMGKGYGFQWRNFGGTADWEFYPKGIGIDQLQNAFNLIKTDPNSRKIIISAWNPQQLDEMVLEPCHCFVQFYVHDGKLSLHWYQRSVDTFLGLPFNIASYALFTIIMAKATGLKPHEIIFSGGDVHIYNNHIRQVTEQLIREPYDFPKIKINKDVSSIEDIEKLKFEDFELVGYKYHPAIKAEMAV